MKVCASTSLIVIALVALFGQVAGAQTNAWTSPASGRWEDPSWSLGVPPGTNHSVFITNSNSKAVAIYPNTPVANRTISNLTISAPSGYANTLLLNFSGIGNPLNVLNDVNILDNGSINNLYGALLVKSNCFIFNGSMVVEGGYWAATNGSTRFVFSTGSFIEAQCVLSNTGVHGGSRLSQTGGVVTADFRLIGGSYFLTNGILRGSLTVGDITEGSGNFYQLGGTNFAAARFGRGNYTLLNGTFVGSVSMDRDSYFYQTNSTASATSIVLNSYYSGSYYSAFNSTNYVGSIGVGSGTYRQIGGLHIVTNGVRTSGFFDSYGPTWSGSYVLHSGMLVCSNVSAGRLSGFVQLGGTNLVSNDVFQDQGGYLLWDGFLQTSNTVVGPNVPLDEIYYFGTTFDQSGGTHVVTNTLTVQGFYHLAGGILSAPTIILKQSRGSEFTISNLVSVPTIINPGLFSAGGRLRLSGSAQQFGILLLADDSLFDFTRTSGQLKFLNSSGAVWSNNVTLTISNWVGSAVGNGGNRLIVGNNANGLTPGQLGQIRFVNPSGFPPGTYLADILPTGEVIPSGIYLFSSQIGNKLIFAWPGTLTLESATNAHGPYLTVPAATSPYTNSFTEPRRFFRLKKP